MKKNLIALVLMMASSGAWAQTDSMTVSSNVSLDVSSDISAPPVYPVAELPPLSGPMTASGRGFFMEGIRLTNAETRDILRPNTEAMNHMRNAQTAYVVAMVTSGVGGYLIGWGLGTDLRHRTNRPSWQSNNEDGSTVGYYVGGAALIGVAAGLSAVTVKEWKKAAAAYNTAMGYASSTPFRRPVTLALSPARNGMGLRLTF